jgi:hypothetical protein
MLHCVGSMTLRWREISWEALARGSSAESHSRRSSETQGLQAPRMHQRFGSSRRRQCWSTYPQVFHAKIYNKRTRMCLSANWGGSVGTGTCPGQSWFFDSELTTIRHAETGGRCLDSNYEGQVYTRPCNGGNFQVWRRHFDWNGAILITQQTSRCLDSDYRGSVYTLPCNGGLFQRWAISSYRSYGDRSTTPVRRSRTWVACGERALSPQAFPGIRIAVFGSRRRNTAGCGGWPRDL